MPKPRDLVLVAIVLTACASGPGAPPPEYPALPKLAGPPAPAPATTTEPAPAPARELKGEWVEFWALSGAADTQRYVFTADGHFEWHAAPQAGAQIVARFGTYAVQGDALELRVRFEQKSGACTTGCRTAVEPERAERLALADCPPNEEAKALDASYRCVAIGDRAFWHR